MIFSNFAFFVFFPIVFALHWGLGSRVAAAAFRPTGIDTHTLRKAILLVASYVFYGWWDAKLLWLIVASTAFDYSMGLALARTDEARRRKLLVTASAIVNLGFLAFFKYYNFFIDSAAALVARLGFDPASLHLEITLPAGISFYTFQSMSYVIDVYRRHMPATKSWLDFFLFVAFFPQLVAGPIVRAVDFIPQLATPPTLDRRRFFDGLERFMIGLFKKLAIADEIGTLVDGVYADPSQFSGGQLLMTAVAFCFQIYADFSGYSDMAIGTARLLGYELSENFRLPYLATSVTEYWRRWHISLSTWFRDYLYIPLGGNRKGAFRTYFNLIATFLLTGLWHGANWTFVMFGAWNGFMLIVERIARHGGERLRLAPPAALRFLMRPVGWLWTAASTVVAFVYFRSANIEQANDVLGRIVEGGGKEGPFLVRKFAYVAALVVIYHGLAVLKVRERLTRSPFVVFLRAFVYVFWLAFMLAFAPIGSRSFIYFQF